MKAIQNIAEGDCTIEHWLPPHLVKAFWKEVSKSKKRKSQYVHLAVVRENRNVRYYLNGILVKEPKKETK